MITGCDLTTLSSTGVRGAKKSLRGSIAGVAARGGPLCHSPSAARNPKHKHRRHYVLRKLLSKIAPQFAGRRRLRLK